MQRASARCRSAFRTSSVRNSIILNAEHSTADILIGVRHENGGGG